MRLEIYVYLISRISTLFYFFWIKTGAYMWGIFGITAEFKGERNVKICSGSIFFEILENFKPYEKPFSHSSLSIMIYEVEWKFNVFKSIFYILFSYIVILISDFTSYNLDIGLRTSEK